MAAVTVSLSLRVWDWDWDREIESESERLWAGEWDWEGENEREKRRRRENPKKRERGWNFREILGKKKEQNGSVLPLSEPGQNRLNRAGSRFSRSNRRFPVFGPFFYIFGFLKEPDRTKHRSPVEPVEPAGPVRFLKPCLYRLLSLNRKNSNSNGLGPIIGINLSRY